MDRSGLDALLLDLGNRLAVEGLCLDAAGCCQLAFDQRWLVTVALHPAGDRLVLHCPISTPGEFGAATLLAMLQGNFMGCATGGGSLAIAPDRRACIQQEIALAGNGPDGRALQQVLERLLAAAETWATRLQDGQGSLLPRRAFIPDRLSRRA